MQVIEHKQYKASTSNAGKGKILAVNRRVVGDAARSPFGLAVFDSLIRQGRGEEYSFRRADQQRGTQVGRSDPSAQQVCARGASDASARGGDHHDTVAQIRYWFGESLSAPYKWWQDDAFFATSLANYFVRMAYRFW